MQIGNSKELTEKMVFIFRELAVISFEKGDTYESLEFQTKAVQIMKQNCSEFDIQLIELL